MKKREIILDFTSLLDVMMTILFFFILFGGIQAKEAKESYEQMQSEAESAYQEGLQMQEDAAEKLAEADRLLDEIAAADERTAANIEGISEFADDGGLKFALAVSDNGWRLVISKGTVSVGEFHTGDTAAKISEAIQAAGQSKGDTMLCQFFYNGEQNGTASAYREINKIMGALKSEYKHMYISETDTSKLMGGNDL